MPVWEFNSIQQQALMMLAMRRREAVELRTMAVIMASSGDRESALECLVRATSLDNPAIAAETEQFSTESAARFEIFKGHWDHMHKKNGGA